MWNIIHGTIVLCYVARNVYDKLIFSKSLKNHIKHVRQVLQILKENGLVIKPSKCL